MTPKKIRAGIIGCGKISHFHIHNIFKNNQTEVVGLCDPYQPSIDKLAEAFVAAGKPVPPSEPDYQKFLKSFDMDVVLIATPHAMHYEHTLAALEAGLDVLLEKPMVVNTRQALDLMAARDRTGGTLVVSFQGSLSPLIRMASASIKERRYGELLSVSATVWQNWGPNTAGTWRQTPLQSGGGFIFDTGAHMLNTVADLVNQDFVEVAAWMDNHGRDVETMSVAVAKLESGAFVTLHGCGETIPVCDSTIKVFCDDAILTTGAWGRTLTIQQAGEPEPKVIPFPPASSVWDTFLNVRAGKIVNPSPPEVGLRMIRLYDAIRLSAQNGGQIAKIEK
ncbi:MAG: Gfo/Idh/MocA family oxidoreductase [Anaerolineaceae bacterium]|nr:Gfo/Idh/MocA family oxidoreductase [Anaerolineaceae bacterium]